MKKVLVTGAAGFIGSSLVDALIKRGDFVIGLDNFNSFYNPAIKRANVVQASQCEHFRLYEGDILDEPLVERIFAQHRPDIVVHLAAWAGVRPSLQNPKLYEEVNIIGSQHIMDACLKYPPSHLVFASSSSVYGGSTRVPFSEDDPVAAPISPYAATKRANELLAHVYSHVHNLHVTMLRFFTVYGPRQRPEMAIHRFVRLVDKDQAVPMYGDGSTQRDYTYIDDILDGVIKAVDSPFRFEIFNLGEHHTTTLRELIEMISRQVGKPAILQELPLQPGDVTITYANIDKARAMLGYAPRYTMEEGIESFVAWYRAVAVNTDAYRSAIEKPGIQASCLEDRDSRG